MALRIGIDIGSTTVKVVVLDAQNKLLFRSYERHYSKPGSAPVRPCGDSGAFWGDNRFNCSLPAPRDLAWPRPRA